jgi:hypothetical protein
VFNECYAGLPKIAANERLANAASCTILGLHKTFGMHSSKLGFYSKFATLFLTLMPVTLWLALRGYRVNVIELRVPSLRERPEDVPKLAEAILRRLGRHMKISPPTLSKDALVGFESYAFPGNVRELENILERAITLNTSGEISSTDIQLRPTRADAPPSRIPKAEEHWEIIWKVSSATPSEKHWNKLDITRRRRQRSWACRSGRCGIG